LAFIPVLAAVLTFITYAYTGHKLEVSTVFSSLLIFNTLRSPLAILMYVIRAMLGGHVAIKRINAYLNSEDADEGYELNQEAPNAVTVDASFAWETRSKTTSASDSSKPSAQDAAKTTTAGPSKSRKEPSPSGPILPLLSDDTASLGNGVEDEAMNDLPFLLQDVKINIARGAFVAIIGKIGSGKSSLMQGMIGEMRRTRGSVTFGGPVAYVPQSPWIMNATLR
jgi:ATP-binding cassette subfamily C (CFTR/MRP) protein 1